MLDDFDVEERGAGTLSVVMPCFNEEGTVESSALRVLKSPFVCQLIIVDDGSTDATLERARAISDPRVVVESLGVNRGKGAAVRHGMTLAVGRFTIIQDADMELDPGDWPELLKPLVAGVADVVYGSRFLISWPRYVGSYRRHVVNKVLTALSNITTDMHLTDMETCYKAFRTELIPQLELRENRFGFEPEFTARIGAMGLRVYEVPVSYFERTKAEGKKIGWRDGVRAVYCIVRYSPRWS